jgi:tetratricopeptide (TPR) repeat protein
MLTPSAADAQRMETTGSRLGSTISGRLVTRFGAPHEIDEVRELLAAGRIEAGLKLAEEYLASLDTVTHTGASSAQQERYLALNAYCVALTKSNRTDDALAACNEAIELQPGRWTGLNNRATVHLTSGRYAQAIADYRRALELSPNETVEALVEHNIELAELRQAAVGEHT